MLPIIYGAQHQRVPPQRFAISHDPMPALLRRLLAVRPDTALALVGDGMLDIRFGRCRLCTPLANLVEVVTEQPRGRSAIGMALSPDGHGLIVGTGRTPSRAGPPEQLVRVRFRRAVSVTGPAGVVLRTRWVAIASPQAGDLAATLSDAALSDAGTVHAGRRSTTPTISAHLTEQHRTDQEERR